MPCALLNNLICRNFGARMMCRAVLCCGLQPALRSGALNTVKQREMIMNGPLKLVQGNFGTIARIPIFIDNATLNETFGTNRSSEWPWLICANHSTKLQLHMQAAAKVHVLSAGLLGSSSTSLLAWCSLCNPGTQLAIRVQEWQLSMNNSNCWRWCDNFRLCCTAGALARAPMYVGAMLNTDVHTTMWCLCCMCCAQCRMAALKTFASTLQLRTSSGGLLQPLVR